MMIHSRHIHSPPPTSAALRRRPIFICSAVLRLPLPSLSSGSPRFSLSPLTSRLLDHAPSAGAAKTGPDYGSGRQEDDDDEEEEGAENGAPNRGEYSVSPTVLVKDRRSGEEKLDGGAEEDAAVENDGIFNKEGDPEESQKGAKPLPLAISISTGLILLFCVPRPEALTDEAWRLLCVFLSTITGLILAPLPVGAWSILCLTISVATGVLPFSSAFRAFTSDVIWLIVFSFFFARGFVKTGLGDRVAALFVKYMGGNTLGLSYGLAVSEALIAPAMPSTTARAAGIFLPIIRSLSVSSQSRPNHPSAKKLGSFLVQCQFQAASHSSALFLTAAAQNLLCLKLAEELGVVLPNPWLQWFEAASLPGVIALLSTPLILYKISPPEIKDTPGAPPIAAAKLDEMGPLKPNEWIMIATMFFAVVLWISGDQIGVTSVVTAMLALSTLLTLGVLSWEDCLSEKAAWDTLIWFAVLVGMSSQLTSLGIVSWLSASVAKILLSLSLSWPVAFLILQASYFFIHYLFASQTAHVGALYSTFLAMHIVAGVPGPLAALALAYNTNIFGGLAHYSSGQAAVYYGVGYVEIQEMFQTGFICGLSNFLLWALLGLGWWKFLGLY